MTDQTANPGVTGEHGPCTRVHGIASTQLNSVEHCRCPDGDDCKVWPWNPDSCLTHESAADHAAACTCTPARGCGDPGEAGCCWCNHRDLYTPCPLIGYGCGWNGGEPCDCCTPEQFKAARVAYSAARAVW